MYMDPITDNVSLKYDEDTEQWSSHYHGFENPIASAGEKKEEALANLVDAVASMVENAETVRQREVINLTAASRDIHDCPDCDVRLDSGHGELGEQKECPSCGQRYVIESVRYLERADLSG